jgi:hypothetical protein
MCSTTCYVTSQVLSQAGLENVPVSMLYSLRFDLLMHFHEKSISPVWKLWPSFSMVCSRVYFPVKKWQILKSDRVHDFAWAFSTCFPLTAKSGGVLSKLVKLLDDAVQQDGLMADYAVIVAHPCNRHYLLQAVVQALRTGVRFDHFCC